MSDGSPVDFANLGAVLRAHELILTRLIAEASPATLQRLRLDLEHHRPPHAAHHVAIPAIGIRTAERLIDAAENDARSLERPHTLQPPSSSPSLR